MKLKYVVLYEEKKSFQSFRPVGVISGVSCGHTICTCVISGNCPRLLRVDGVARPY